MKEIYADCIDFDPNSPRSSTSSIGGGELYHTTEGGYLWMDDGGTLTPRQIRNARPDPALSSDIRRTFQSLGTLRGVVKLTLRVYDKWDGYQRHFITLAPNIRRLVLIPITQRPADQVKAIPDLPQLRHLTIEAMFPEYDAMIARFLGRCRSLEGLVMMDWNGRWENTNRSSLIEMLKKRRGVKMLFVPKKMYDLLEIEEMKNVQTLGIQGGYYPSLRLSVSRANRRRTGPYIDENRTSRCRLVLDFDACSSS